jgi:MYXO-CTERM domain-containing protein
MKRTTRHAMVLAAALVGPAAAPGECRATLTLYTDQAKFLSDLAHFHPKLHNQTVRFPGGQSSTTVEGRAGGHRLTVNGSGILDTLGPPSNLIQSFRDTGVDRITEFPSREETECLVSEGFILTEYQGATTTFNVVAHDTTGGTFTFTPVLARGSAFIGILATKGECIKDITARDTGTGITTKGGVTTAFTPEPSSFVMAGLGALGLAAAAWKRRKA